MAVFALFAAFVVFWPGPASKPAEAPVAPVAAEIDDAPAAMPTVRPDPTPAEHEAMLQYSVQEGDTVAEIARLFRVTEENLRWANRIPEGGGFDPGDKIWLPAP